MRKKQLILYGLSEVEGMNDTALAILVDKERERALNVMLTRHYYTPLLECLRRSPKVEKSMAAVAGGLLQEPGATFSLEITGIIDAVYQSQIVKSRRDKDSQRNSIDRAIVARRDIYIGDGLLMAMVNEWPILIGCELMFRQSSRFRKDARSIALPINALDTRRLRIALDKAVSNEDYRLAATLRDELRNRSTSKERLP